MNRLLNYYNSNKSFLIKDNGSMCDNNIVLRHSSNLFKVLDTNDESIISNVLMFLQI